MLNIIKESIAKGVLKGITSSNDTKTTALGFVAAGILAANLDFGKLFAGDHSEIGKLAGALTVGALGFYTNKPAKPTLPPAPPKQ